MRKAVSLIISVFLLFSCALTVCAEESVAEEKTQVCISFDTMGGSECESIYGYAGETKITEDMLPTPAKEGYVFTGWHHFSDKGAPFELTVFPNFDITLFAAFEPTGFTVNFEGSMVAPFDYNSGIELYGPKSEGYDSSLIKSGWNSLRTKKGKESPMFLLSYQDELEVGREYELTIWILSDNEKTRGEVDLVFAENPDVRDVPLGYVTAFETDDVKEGEWCKKSVKFIAAAPYVVIRLPNTDNLYVEDLEIQQTGKMGQPAQLKQVKKTNIVFIVVLISVLIVLAAATVTVILKRNKQN